MQGGRSRVWLADTDTAQRAPGSLGATRGEAGLTASALASRMQRIVTIAAAQAQVASREAARFAVRAKATAAICASAGVLGLGCSGATLLPDLVPSGLAFMLGLFGIVLGIVPVGLLARLASRSTGTQETRHAATAARAMAAANVSHRLAAAIAETTDGLSAAHLGFLERMIDAAEADIDRVRRDARAVRPVSANVRRHERIQPHHRRVIVKTADGRQLVGRIADVSLSGVALSEQLPRLAVGDEVMIGQQRAVATRLWASGIAFAFKTELDPSTFNADIVL